MKRKLNKSDLVNLAHGCCFFASGGGGSLSSGLNLLEKFEGEATIISKEEAVADKESYTLVVAYIGAPDAIVGNPTAAINAFKLMNKVVNNRIKYVVPVELGALSTIVSCVVAKELDLKVIDGDGAGRAVPELTQLTYASNVTMGSTSKDSSDNIIPSAILASKDDQQVEMIVKSPAAVEAIARPFISSGIPGFDQAAGLAIWLMNSETLDKALSITDTIDLSLKLGKEINEGLKNPYKDVLGFLSKNGLQSELLFTGIMSQPTETTSGGFDMDKVVIRDETSDVEMHIYAQNESLIAWKTDTANPVIIAPDSICYLSKDGKVFSNADITNGGFVDEEVGVIAILSREQLTIDQSIMKSFDAALTDIGYPSLYIPWNKISEK